MGALVIWEFVKRFAPLIIGALVILALVGAWMGYGKARYNQGYAAAEAQYVPQLQLCSTARDSAVSANKEAEKTIKNLKAAYGDLEAAVKALEARERVARLRGERLKAELAKKEREFIEQAARLEAIITGPKAPTREEACDGADKILTEEARARSGKIR